MIRARKIIEILIILPTLGMAQITGLSGWDIFVDPGHSQNENMPPFSWGISEAKRNLQVALHLKEMLMTETDIDTVFLSRKDNVEQVSLSQRSTLANILNTQWFHSIHSDASSSPAANSTLLLWGGWRENGQTVEKTPQGGQAMSKIMVDLLTQGMRTNTRGDYADRTFYQGFPTNHDNKFPYLHVNRETIMASELSESGFHTNYRQNQLFMNNDWLRLEARTFFWSILAYHGINRPVVNILTGIVSDQDTGQPLNGAVISAADRQYVTDTYESLFNQFTSDPDLLHNGFYYFEDMNYDSVTIIAQAEDYYPDTVKVGIRSDFFTFRDFQLISNVPPTVVFSNPVDGDTGVSILDPLEIRFSRPMDRSSVESQMEVNPQVPLSFNWKDNNTRLQLISDSLQFLTTYTLTLPGTVTDPHGHLLDGNGDGVGGDVWSISFTTGQDVYPPQPITFYPSLYENGVERRPIINVEFDEELDSASVTSDVFILEDFANKEAVPGILKHHVVDDRSVINFFPLEPLMPEALYVTRIYAGLRDRLGNETTRNYSASFNTGAVDEQVTLIDPLEAGFTTNWWEPGNSGSTTGILLETSRSENSQIVNLLTGSSRSLKLRYGWDLNANDWLIRMYLSGGSPRSVHFDTSYTLQAYIFGDGSGTRFRFALDDNVDQGASASWHEVSQWIDIDWIGWRRVEWDLSDPESVGDWLGDKVLEGTLRFDSFQFTYQLGAADTGTVYIDDLRLVKKKPVTNIQAPVANTIPEDFQLEQNYPNPFNPVTRIAFTIPERTHVRIAVYNTVGQLVQTLLSENRNPGTYEIQFDASQLPSGVYVYRIQAGNFVEARKMILMK